jgi:hypothetical protein
MDHAAAILHPHCLQVGVDRAGMDQMHLQAQRLPAVNLVIQLRIRPTHLRRKRDDAEMVHGVGRT